MTDYSKLIARVRSPFALTELDAQEIADALEAQERELEAKCKECSDLKIELAKWVNYWRDKDNKTLQARIAKLEAEAAFAEKELLHTLKVKNEGDARIAELEAALTPLAEMDYWIEPHHDAHDSIEQCNQLTVAEILAARAALKAKRDD